MWQKAVRTLGLTQQNCSHVEGYFQIFCNLYNMWSVRVKVLVVGGSCCDHSEEMFGAGPLLPSHSFLIVPFGANEPEMREGNSEFLSLLLNSSKFVPRKGKTYFYEMVRPVLCGLVKFFFFFFFLPSFSLTRQSNFNNADHFLTHCFMLMFIHVLLIVQLISSLSLMCWYQHSGIV